MEENKQTIYYLNVEDILPNRFQPRLAFDEKELNDLSNSIIKYGVIQPIVVRKISDKYEIIAGERRYKAACLAGLKTIPAIINNTDDNTSAEIALLENLQRKDLSVIEEAQSYKKLLDKGFTQEEIANKLSVSQSAIANRLRLLTLPKEVKDALLYNKISERHARSLLSLNNPDLQVSLLNRIINEKLTVRQTEDEISLMLMKNNNYIPDEIQRFLNPDSNPQVPAPTLPQSNDVEFMNFGEPHDIVDVKEEMVDTVVPQEVNQNVEELHEEKTDSYAINPFQTTSTSENVSFDQPQEEAQNKVAQVYTDILNDIKRYADNNEKIKIDNIELLDKYQIIIDINKY